MRRIATSSSRDASGVVKRRISGTPASLGGLVVGRTALAVEPLRELVADVGDGGTGLGEGVADPRRVVRGGGVGLVAQRRLLPAADVVALDRPGVGGPAGPSQQP